MDEQAIAVLAHGLLGSVALVVDATDRLATSWADLAEADRAVLLRRVREHVLLVGGILQDLARGLPHDVVAALDKQRHSLPGDVVLLP
jgi:hypothetical protein